MARRRRRRGCRRPRGPSTWPSRPAAARLLARERDERRLALERGDLGAEPGQDRRLVAGARADLEDPVARLAPRGCSVILATMNGWLIVWPAPIGRAPSAYASRRHGLGDERLARDRAHRGEDALIGDARGRAAGVRPSPRVPASGSLRRTGHGREDTPHDRLLVSPAQDGEAEVTATAPPMERPTARPRRDGGATDGATPMARTGGPTRLRRGRRPTPARSVPTVSVGTGDRGGRAASGSRRGRRGGRRAGSPTKTTTLAMTK